MIDYTKRVQRKGMEALKTSFVGFKGEDKVVLKDGQYGIAKDYTISDFERLYDFVNDADLETYLTQLENKMEHQYVEEKLDEQEEVFVEEEQEDKKDDTNKDKEKDVKNENTHKPVPVGAMLKDKLINECLAKKDYHDKLTTIECKDGSTSYRYRNLTILQVKGKRKVVVYMTGKLLSDETLALFDKTPEEQKATHNAYLYLNSTEDLDAIMKAMDESVEQVDIKRDGDKVPEPQDKVEDEQKLPGAEKVVQDEVIGQDNKVQEQVVQDEVLA